MDGWVGGWVVKVVWAEAFPLCTDDEIEVKGLNVITQLMCAKLGALPLKSISICSGKKESPELCFGVFFPMI